MQQAVAHSLRSRANTSKANTSKANNLHNQVLMEALEFKMGIPANTYNLPSVQTVDAIRATL